MNSITSTASETITICDGCELIPISHLSLDVAEPLSGWPATLAERGVEVLEDDLGRPSIPRRALGELLSEHRQREARLAEESRQRAELVHEPVPAGVPAVEGASPYESLVAAGGVVIPAQEFGRPKPNFLDEALAAGRKQAADARAEAELLDKALAAGRKQAADARAEAELLDKAQRVLDGRDKK